MTKYLDLQGTQYLVNKLKNMSSSSSMSFGFDKEIQVQNYLLDNNNRYQFNSPAESDNRYWNFDKITVSSQCNIKALWSKKLNCFIICHTYGYTIENRNNLFLINSSTNEVVNITQKIEEFTPNNSQAFKALFPWKYQDKLQFYTLYVEPDTYTNHMLKIQVDENDLSASTIEDMGYVKLSWTYSDGMCVFLLDSGVPKLLTWGTRPNNTTDSDVVIIEFTGKGKEAVIHPLNSQPSDTSKSTTDFYISQIGMTVSRTIMYEGSKLYNIGMVSDTSQNYSTHIYDFSNYTHEEINDPVLNYTTFQSIPGNNNAWLTGKDLISIHKTFIEWHKFNPDTALFEKYKEIDWKYPINSSFPPSVWFFPYKDNIYGFTFARCSYNNHTPVFIAKPVDEKEALFYFNGDGLNNNMFPLLETGFNVSNNYYNNMYSVELEDRFAMLTSYFIFTIPKKMLD